MGSKDTNFTTLERKGRTLQLVYRPRPPKPVIWIAALVAMGVAVPMALWWREPDATVVVVAVALILGVFVLGFSLLILKGARLIGTTTTFDIDARRVDIVTETKGKPDIRVSMNFDDVTELRVLQQRSEGTQIETMTIAAGNAKPVIIATERSIRSYSVEPHTTRLKDFADRIAAETSLPRGKPQMGAVSGVAAAMGMKQS